jgi:peptide/nickel transport system permease protein
VAAQTGTAGENADLGQYVVRRLVEAIPVVAISSVLIFLLLHIIPGDPAVNLAGEEATDADIAAAREKLGLNDPLPVQYWNWLSKAARGDLGASFQRGPSVGKRIATALPPTIELTLVSFTISLSVGITAGVLAGVWPRSAWDWGLSGSTVVFIAIPNFVFGLVALWVFGFHLKLFPITGRVPLWTDPFDSLRHLALPALTLGLTQAAILGRFTRTAVSQVMHHPYVTTARAKGLSERVVIMRHVLRNALIAVITIASLQVAALLTGSVVIETVFSRPGLGRVIVNAVQGRDIPTVQGMMILLVSIFIVVNLAADVAYGIVNPRIRSS